MTRQSLVPQPPALRLPVAQMRSVFHPGDVERKLSRLQESGNQREYETLRTVYERMLERGPERFQVKPSGVPDMASLYEQLPNFTEALDDVKRHVALAQDSSDGLEVTPMLLLGPPGIGKTHFARHLAELLGTGMSLVPMSSMTAGWLLSGASSQWKGAKPGKVFEALVEGQYANPVIVVDEIDKAAADAQYDPLGALYGLLEHDTAEAFMDEFAEVAIDASQVIWILTANDDRAATMHTVAARTDRELLPAAVAALLDRNDQRRAHRAQAWRQHTAQNRARDAAYQRLTATTQRAAQRQRSRSRDRGYGREL